MKYVRDMKMGETLYPSRISVKLRENVLGSTSALTQRGNMVIGFLYSQMKTSPNIMKRAQPWN